MYLRMKIKRSWSKSGLGRQGRSAKSRSVSLAIAFETLLITSIMQLIIGRQKLKKSYQYEVKWRGLDHKFNTWVPRDDLLEKGFTKVVQQFDDLESSREGAGSREITLAAVRKHLEEVGLDGDIAQYNEMSGLSGGQKMKVVIAAALWNNPQVRCNICPTITRWLMIRLIRSSSWMK